MVRWPTGSDWLVDRLPERLSRPFHRVKEVWLGHAVTDADLAECGKLWCLQEIDSGFCYGATDAGVAHLKKMTQLRVLSMQTRGVTDVGLVHLKGLSQLQDISLSNTQVTNAGLANLSAMLQLGLFDLNFTQVGDAGLMHLKRLTRLDVLKLAGTKVMDD